MIRSCAMVAFAVLPAIAVASPCEDLARAICPSADMVGECLYFANGQMREPEGKTFTGADRLRACQRALGDEARLGDLKARMRAKSETRWFTMAVNVEPRKADGSTWDASGGAPDIAACFEVDERSIGCRPEGKSHTKVRRAECENDLRCDFDVHARRGSIVTVVFVDVDEGGSDRIGTCAFTAGRGTAQCEGPLSLATEGAAPAAGADDLRILGRWELDVEGTMAKDPQSAGLSPEQRVKAIEAAAGSLGETYMEFGRDGRLTLRSGEDRKSGQYTVTASKGDSLTVKATDDEGQVTTMKIAVTVKGIEVREGGQTLVFVRTP